MTGKKQVSVLISVNWIGVSLEYVESAKKNFNLNSLFIYSDFS